MGAASSMLHVGSATRCIPLTALPVPAQIALAVVFAISLFSKPPRLPPPQLVEGATEILEEITNPTAKQAQESQETTTRAKKKKSQDYREEEPLSAQVKIGIVIRDARQHLGVDCINHYNFAVTGQTGVGKSSFVNAILSLEDSVACAPVGEVETTQEIRSYSNTKWPSLKLWDIPGSGTRKHPAATYFEDKKLYVFDAILILTSDRFLDVDFHILRSARKFNTPCVFVRTKCDISVENRAKRDKVNALEASKRLRAEVSRSFHEGLANAGLIASLEITPHLYFISNKFLEDEDAYSIYDKKTKTWDSSLSSMDEQALITFLLDAAKIRA